MPEESEKEAKKYWIYVSGRHNIAVLFDRPPEEGGQPLLYVRSEFDKAESAEGLHLGMALQDLGPPGPPPNFSHVGTEEEALKLVRREAAVAEFITLLIAAVLGEYDDDLVIMSLQEAEKLLDQEDVLARVKELDPVVPMMIEALRFAFGDDSIVKLRAHLETAQSSRVEKLLFGDK